MGSPAHAHRGTMSSQTQHPDTIFMMGGNPALLSQPIQR
jgi:hypothetical protein